MPGSAPGWATQEKQPPGQDTAYSVVFQKLISIMLNHEDRGTAAIAISLITIKPHSVRDSEVLFSSC